MIKLLLASISIFITLFSTTLKGQPLTISQGIHEQSFSVELINEDKPVVTFNIERDGLLIVEIKQQGDFLSERLWIDGTPQLYMDLFGFTEGSDYVSKKVKTGDIVSLEIKSYFKKEINNNIDIVVTIVSTEHKSFDEYLVAFNTINLLAKKTKQAYSDSGKNFKNLLEQTLQLSTQTREVIRNLPFEQLKQNLTFNHAVLLSDIGKRKQSFELFESLRHKKVNRALTLLTNYYAALLLPDYFEQEELLSILDKAILSSNDYNSYLYENARMDQCTALQQQASDNTLECFELIIKEQLLEHAPLKLAVLQSNLAHLSFSKHKYMRSIILGKNSLETLEKIKDNAILKQSYAKKKAIFEYQQAIRLNSLGLENHALEKILSSIKVFSKYNQREFLLNSIIEVGNIYLSNNQGQIAHYLASFVLSNITDGLKSDHYHLLENALFLAAKSAIYEKKTDAAQEYINQIYKLSSKNSDKQAEYKMAIQFFKYQISKSPKLAKELIELFKESSSSNRKKPKWILRVTQLLIKTNNVKGASELIAQLNNAKLSFKDEIAFLKYNSQLSLLSKKNEQAIKTVNKAIDRIEIQYRHLDNIGLKRNFYGIFSDVFALKTKILISQYETHKDVNLLYEASQLNFPKIAPLRENQYDISSSIERQQIANELADLTMNESNTVKIVTKLLALENFYNKNLKQKKTNRLTQLQVDNAAARGITLHYVLMSNESLLFIYQNNKITFHRLPSEEIINSQIKSLFLAIEKRSDSAFTIAQKISEILIPKKLWQSPNVQELTVIGSGLTWQLPFNILPDIQSSTWKDKLLIDKFIVKKSLTLKNSSSLLDLPKINILSISDPIFSNNDARAPKINAMLGHSKTLSRLKSSRVETLSLKRSFNNNKIEDISGFSATKSKFIELVNNTSPTLIHIASHSFASSEEYRNAGIFFTALNRSGEQQDHVLKLQEIEQLRNNAELVVLSACDSNIGKTTFKSPIDGLAIAFINSGARRVLASQWKVPSRSTALLMKNFYRHLSNSKSYSLALRSASQDVRKQYQYPARWAGFTITHNYIGEPHE